MGRRGPAPESDEALAARGSRAAKKRRVRGQSVPAGVPACPDWLSREAKAEWRRIIPLIGRISTADRGTIIAYCEASAEFRQAVEELAAGGQVVEQANGVICVSPWIKIRDSADRRRRAAMADLGITLRDRPKDSGEGEEDPLEKRRREAREARQANGSPPQPT